MRSFSMTISIIAMICLLWLHIAFAQQPNAHAPIIKPAVKTPSIQAPATHVPETPRTPENGKPPITIQNEFVRVVVNGGPNEVGRFSITTTGGDPDIVKSKDKRLIYGGNKPWTSYTTVKLDDACYAVGGPTNRRTGQGLHYGTTVSGPVVAENQINYNEKIGDIEVTQKLGFVRGPSTRMHDTVGISYSLTNRGMIRHNVGVRILLDTMCGDNDGAPMRVGTLELKDPLKISDKDQTIPDYWQAFDNLTTPTVISQGSLHSDIATRPNEIYFADWGTLTDDPWQPELNPKQGFIRKNENDPDTAMAMLWRPVVLEPGKTITYVTYYGIGYIDVIRHDQTTLGLTAPGEATFEDERTQPITVTGYLQNTGKYEGRDIVLTLTTPDGLELCSGSPLKINKDKLRPGEMLQGSWVLMPNGKSGGKKKLSLSVNSTNFETSHVSREINVIVPKSSFIFAPDKQRVLFGADEPKPVIVEVNMNSATDFSGFSLMIQFDPAIIHLLDVSRGRDIVDVANGKDRPLQWKVDKTKIAKGILTFSGQRIDDQGKHVADLTQWEVNLATLSFYTVKSGISTLKFTKAELISKSGDKRPVDISKDMKNGEVEVVRTDATAIK